MSLRFLVAIAAVALAVSAAAAPSAPDPFAWLEDIHSPRALAWVEQQNARTAARLETDPRYAVYHREALALLTAEDRIPQPTFLGDDIGNFWQDSVHTKGLWRRASFASYNSPAPQWETLLDLDALSKAEGKNWIFKGATCLPPEDRLCLVRLSNGGGDAVELREFDTRAKAFVPGGFRFASAKQSAAWLDADTLLLARDFGPGTLTTSGYPYIVKQVKRGQPGVEVFHGDPKEVGAGAELLRGPNGAVEHVLFRRSVRTFESRYWLLLPDGSQRALDLPLKTDVRGYVDRRLIVSLNEDWPARGFTAGDLIAYEPLTGQAELVFRPGPTQTVNDAAVTQNRLLVELLDNVNGALDVYRRGPDGWSAKRLPLPRGLAITLVSSDHQSDRAYIATESFLEPTSLWSLDAATGGLAKVKSLPPRFDATGDVTEQHFATSKDGTRIPYWLVRPKGMKPDG
ncbi:MAG TPA: S9 family peptidase, partial [Caulobacteraceae bacterium]